jgi:hypothetical protein
MGPSEVCHPSEWQPRFVQLRHYDTWGGKDHRRKADESGECVRRAAAGKGRGKGVGGGGGGRGREEGGDFSKKTPPSFAQGFGQDRRAIPE